MLLPELLGDVPYAQFLETHYTRAPLVRRGTARALKALMNWNVVDRLVDQTACDLVLVRDGEVHRGERPASAACRAMFEEGYSIVLRDADRHDYGLAGLGRAFRADLGGDLALQLYCTPPSHHSFGWHYDTEEVFFLQLSGEKVFTLRENTVDPLPVPETLPRVLELERETSPEQTFALAPGDWLYIPSGWWHRSVAQSPSLSISVGVIPWTPIEVLARVRQKLLADPRWRRRLPAGGLGAQELGESTPQRYRDELGALAEAVRAELADPALLAALLSGSPRR